jgi:hypothetical protein
MTLAELKESCAYWQEKLGLSHWRVGIRIERARNMPLGDSQGCNEFSIDTERALISILDPGDYPEGPFGQDMEATLVHELLHIPFRYISDPEQGTLERVHLESTVDRLARALVSLKREN